MRSAFVPKANIVNLDLFFAIFIVLNCSSFRDGNEGDSSTSNQNLKIHDIKVLANNIDKYGGLLILITGGIGNSITLLVLSQKSMKQFAVNICLITMTTGDLLHTVIGQAGRHMIRGFYGIDLTSLSAVYCKIWCCIVSYPLIYSTYALVGKLFFALF